jgi:hypothetical protein
MNAKPAERHGPYLVLDKGTEDSAPKSAVISLRIRPELRAEMDRVANAGSYRIAITALVERGIVLAIRELDELAERLK